MIIVQPSGATPVPELAVATNNEAVALQKETLAARIVVLKRLHPVRNCGKKKNKVVRLLRWGIVIQY